jgi:D-tyrosyl-tRNA(Tyr) deacylase
MRAVVQIVRDASVEAGGSVTGKIDHGLLVYLGVARGDTPSDADYLAEKTAALRIFDDGEGRMNLSVRDIGGGVIVVSQFTLLADARKGRRPSYSNAADPAEAEPLYEYFMGRIRAQGLSCGGGIFRARMLVRYTNDGPVTVLLDSKKQF